MPGEGSIFRRASDGAWIAQLSIGPRSDRRFLSRSAKSRVEALRKLDDLKAIRAGNAVSSRMALGDYLGRWVRDARNIRPSTRHGYEAVVTTHLRPTIGDIALADLSPAHVEQALAALEPRMKPKTLRNVHVVLRRALAQAVRAGLVMRNVAAREFVDAPRVPDADPRSLTEDEVRRLLAIAKGDRIEALVITALGTGLRQGELLGLAWEDIGATHLRVHLELVRRDGRYFREPPKTSRSRREVPLSPGVAAALEAHRERVIAEGFVPTSTGPVFINRTGGELSGSWVTHRFHELLDEAGIARLPFKNLRTTFSSQLHEKGVPDRIIADLLGHTRTRTTQQHYISTNPEQAVAAIARLVG